MNLSHSCLSGSVFLLFHMMSVSNGTSTINSQKEQELESIHLEDTTKIICRDSTHLQLLRLADRVTRSENVMELTHLLFVLHTLNPIFPYVHIFIILSLSCIKSRENVMGCSEVKVACDLIMVPKMNKCNRTE